MAIAAAALPAIMSSVAGAMPGLIGSMVMKQMGAIKTERERNKAMNRYYTETDQLGRESTERANKALQRYDNKQMTANEAEDQANQEKAYASTKLPDIAVPQASATGGPASIDQMIRSAVEGEREQSGRKFTAGTKLNSLSNTLFGNSLDDTNAASIVRNRALLAKAAEARLENQDLPKANQAGAVFDSLGSLFEGAGNIMGASAAANVGAKGVAKNAMGGIGTIAPKTVGRSVSAPIFSGLGGARLKG